VKLEQITALDGLADNRLKIQLPASCNLEIFVSIDLSVRDFRLHFFISKPDSPIPLPFQRPLM